MLLGKQEQQETGTRCNWYLGPQGVTGADGQEVLLELKEQQGDQGMDRQV